MDKHWMMHRRRAYWFSPVQFAVVAVVLGLVQNAGAGLSVFETELFSGSGRCAFCHSGLVDETGDDVSNDAMWRSTIMANAGKDPLWQAKVSSEVEVQGGKGLEQIIQEKCSRCHMGMARCQQTADDGHDEGVYILDDGFLNSTHYLHQAAMDGVSCTLCHQIKPDGLSTEYSYTGQYVIDAEIRKPDRSIFGPFEFANHNSMVGRAGFTPQVHSPFMQLHDSAFCGTCHTLYTPSLDENSRYLGEFPEQTTYLEWEHSSVEQTCQDCHMPAAEGAVKISRHPRRIVAKEPFKQHHFVGGNVSMVNLLKENRDEMGVTASGAHLDATTERTLDQLQEKTAKLIVEPTLSENQQVLSLAVTVQNLVGHKFPSGFPSRRAWLHVTVEDGDGKVVFESGRPNDDGSIVGNDADNNDGYESHYSLITEEDQVQIYEPVMHTVEGGVTYTLLRANSYAKDNRLLPAGFDKVGAVEDIAVWGAAVDDEDFVGGSDIVDYAVTLGEYAGELRIRAELLFQSLSYPFIIDLAAQQTELVDRFMGMHANAENIPVVIDTVELEL